MEPEGSLPSSQEYIQSTTLHSIFVNHSSFIFPSTLRSSESSLPSRLSNHNTVCRSQPSHECYMFRQSFSPLFDHPNAIWWSVQVMQSFVASHHFPLLGPNIPTAPVLKHPHFAHLP